MNKDGGKKNSKTKELLYEVIMSDEFWRDVARIRKEYDIPLEGFKNENEKIDWLEKLNLKALKIFTSEIDLSIKYQIPIFNRADLTWYVYFGNPNQRKLNSQTYEDTDVLIDPIAHKDYALHLTNPDRLYVDAKQPFVKLYIFDTATSKGTTKFIKENWEKIQEILMEQRQDTKKRIRVKNNRERDELIYELSKKSTKELKQLAKQTKEMAIAKIMRENEYSEVTDIIVKKIIVQQNKLRKRSL